jgi:hypothetical protein
MSQIKPPFKVKAIAPYKATSPAEITLTVGQELEVLDTDGRGVWWQAKRPDGSIGWFPANYTQIITPSSFPPPPPSVGNGIFPSFLNLYFSVKFIWRCFWMNSGYISKLFLFFVFSLPFSTQI